MVRHRVGVTVTKTLPLARLDSDYDSQWAAISWVAQKLGMTPETLRKWVRTAEIDGGLRAGVSTEERARIKELERENRELRRANEILKTAAAFFGAELDRKQRR
jgi:transposase